MAITCTPTVTRLINKARREIVMSVEIDDGDGDVRTVSGTGKTLTDEQSKALLDAIVKEYQRQRAHETTVTTVKQEMESDAKTYLEGQLNG